MHKADEVTQISLKLPKLLNDELLKKAELLNLSKSKAFRQALESYLYKDSATFIPKQIVVQVHFLAQLIKNVDSLDIHKELIRQQMEVLECLIGEENHFPSSNG